MRYKAVLINALVIPFGGGEPKPWQVFQPTREKCEALGRGILATLSKEEQETAYISIVEIKEIVLAEIHTAVEKGPNGELRFAIAEL